jgi:mono/diheme cytochrome c family protein
MHLLQASIHRQRREKDKWEASLQQARRHGAPDPFIAIERKLGRFQWGRLGRDEEEEAGMLTSAGASPGDVATAILRGCVAQRNAARAKAYLEQLPAEIDGAHRDFLWGVYWRSQGDRAEAEKRLRKALEAQPGHELARMEIAELLVDTRQFAKALQEYATLAARSSGNEAALIGLVRVLRAQARLEEARAALAPLASGPKPSRSVLYEMAWIELEYGNPEEAEKRLCQLPFDEANLDAMYSATLITLSLGGKGVEVRRFFDKSAARTRRRNRISELLSWLANHPNDTAAGAELQQLDRERLSTSFEDAFGPAAPGKTAGGGPAADLYARHCAACHGETGDGRGPASRHLFPRPRDLRNDRSALVSTLNTVPTQADLEKVLADGMPGSSMPAFRSTLTESQRSILAQEVVRLRREGVREQVLRDLREEEGETIDEADVRRVVDNSTVPGNRVQVPSNWPGPVELAEVTARGRESYRSLGCNKCHGEDGTGAGGEPLFDGHGEPVLARDLVDEPFKGGREPESIYLRLAAGMPGTPHPAASNLREAELTALVQYVRSLERGPQRLLTNFERRVRADARSETITGP